MARAINRLNARRVQTITTPGRHADGGGLYLLVEKGGAKRWVFLYRLPGKRREMGLGGVTSVPLARAREKAAEARALVDGGVDPVQAKQAAKPVPEPERRAITFADVAETFMADREVSWRNATHRRQWHQTLSVQAATIWSMPVADVTTADVLAVLRPMWATKAETARRLRARLERILGAAKAGGHRTGENPAAWRGHLDAILPKAAKLTRGHHAALPYADVPAFMAALREREAVSARALELLILTTARSGEVRGMTWGEVDLAGAEWSVPAARMKARRGHDKPLPPRAVELLSALRPPGAKPTDLVFPNGRGAAHSDMVFTALLKRMGRGDVTAHGFRSSFKDWAANETDYPDELSEEALAHLVGDATRRAYRRGEATRKRRGLMDDWAHFCGSAADGAPRR